MAEPTSDPLDDCCPECGAAVRGGRAACQQRFDQLLALEFGDYRYAQEHRLMVDAYCLQHPDEYMRSAKSYAAHLTGVCVALEHDAPAETNRAVQQWLNGARILQRPRPPAPRQRGKLTVVYVQQAREPEEHARRVREWAQSAWEAWGHYRLLAKDWVAAAISHQRSVSNTR